MEMNDMELKIETVIIRIAKENDLYATQVFELLQDYVDNGFSEYVRNSLED